MEPWREQRNRAVRELYALIKRKIAEKEEEPEHIRRYRQRDRREGKFEIVDKAALEQAVADASTILVGDYHTSIFAQRTLLSIVQQKKEAEQKKKAEPHIILGLEFIRPEDEQALKCYLDGQLSRENFLRDVEYEKRWGYDWERTRLDEFLQRIKKTEVTPIGLNIARHEGLQAMDRAVAEYITATRKRFPEAAVIAFIGEHHLQKKHLPSLLKEHQPLVILQDAEEVYFRLMDEGKDHATGAVKLKDGRFCIMDAGPLITADAYLRNELMADAAKEEHEEVDHMLAEKLVDFYTSLFFSKGGREFFKIKKGETLDEKMTFFHDADEFWGLFSEPRLRSDLQEQARAYKMLAIHGKLQFDVYLKEPTLNRLTEAIMGCLLLAANGKPYGDPVERFYDNILHTALAFVGSKLINPKRKHKNGEYFQKLLEEPDHSKHATARLVLEHLRHQHVGSLPKGYYLDLAGKSLRTQYHVMKYLGRKLGAQLYGQLDREECTMGSIAALAHPCKSPREKYFMLAGR